VVVIGLKLLVAHARRTKAVNTVNVHQVLPQYGRGDLRERAAERMAAKEHRLEIVLQKLAIQFFGNALPGVPKSRMHPTERRARAPGFSIRDKIPEARRAAKRDDHEVATIFDQHLRVRPRHGKRRG